MSFEYADMYEHVNAVILIICDVDLYQVNADLYQDLFANLMKVVIPLPRKACTGTYVYTRRPFQGTSRLGYDS